MNDTTTTDTDPLDPDISARGFAHMQPLAGLYGGTVRVYESSSAEHDALWFHVNQDPESRLDKRAAEATLHLDMPTAMTLTEQIRALAAGRGYTPPADPEHPATWRDVVRAFRSWGWEWRGHAGPGRTANPVGDDGRPDRRLGSVTVTRARGRWRVTVQGPGTVAARTVDLIDPAPGDVLHAVEYTGLGRARPMVADSPEEQPVFLDAQSARAETHAIEVALNQIAGGRDPRATMLLQGLPLTTRMLEVIDWCGDVVNAMAWREVASWVRHRCAHQMGVPVCDDCLDLAGHIQAHADTIGGTADVQAR